MPNSGLDMMIDSDKMDDLTRLYRLFTMVPAGLPCLKRSLKESISRRGKEINRASFGIDDAEAGENVDTGTAGKDKARPRTGAQTLALALQWVQDVLDLKDCFDQVWKRAFQRDRELESALNDVGFCLLSWCRPTTEPIFQSFETFVNLNEKSPEYVSLFIDENLKKGIKGVSASRYRARCR